MRLPTFYKVFPFLLSVFKIILYLISFVSLYSLAKENSANTFLAGGMWISDTFATPSLEIWASCRTARRETAREAETLNLSLCSTLLESFFYGKEEE